MAIASVAVLRAQRAEASALAVAEDVPG
jgi:hypothetical protein